MSHNKSVLLAFVCLFATRVSAGSRLGKCCPPGRVFSENAKVECVSVPSNTMQLYVLQRNATAGFQGLPQCDEPEDMTIMPFDSVGSNGFVEVPACVEILHEQITGESTVVIVYCRSNEDRQVKAIDTSLQLAHIRKCCPHDTIFDKRMKSCVSWPNESQSLITFLPDGSAEVDLAIVATEGPPTCGGPIVDYEIDRDDIRLRNNIYSVIVPAFKNNFILKEDLFINEDNACLETATNTVSNRRLIARICREPEFCNRNACIRKCCAEDKFFYPNGCNKLLTSEEPKEFHDAFASAVNQTELSAFNTSNDYGVLIGKKCQYGMYPVHPSEEKWFATSEGHVLIEGYPVYRHDDYCMDIFYNNSVRPFDRDFHLFICFDNDPLTEERRQASFRVNTILEIISCTFLLITLLVYACLPSLQNLHGKTLMCHVSSLFLAFACLVVITWVTPGGPFTADDKEIATIMCTALAYTMLFCFLSSFSWLNVMCFDIWWTFGILRGSTITKARGHRKKFLLYCLYAWGLSFLGSILAIVADRTDILPDYLQPDIGNSSCWFTQDSGSYGELTFFIGPVTVQLMINVVFFILTLMHCNKVKAEIRRMTTDPADPRSKRFQSDKIRLIMNIKLFVVMGISWTCEVISFLLKKYLEDVSWHEILFYASDVFNLLQGLLIFILFVLKKRVYQALRKRLGLNYNSRPSPTCNATTALQDPFRVRKSASNTTLTTTFAISAAP